MKYLRIQTDTRGASWIYLGLVAVIADAVETTRCVDAEVARLVRMTTLINVYTPINSHHHYRCQQVMQRVAVYHSHDHNI